MAGEFLIRLDNADVALSGHTVLQAINWEITQGQHWRIDGINGSGKTTLLKTVAGLLWPVSASPPTRVYGFNDKTTHLLFGVRKYIGYASYTMQDDYVRGVRNISAFEVIASGFEQTIMNYNELTHTQHQAIDQLAFNLELRGILQQPFLALSHGQKSAVLFARAIIHRPKILILDEIFNGVDHQRFELMIEQLCNYKNLGGNIVLAWHQHGIPQIETLFTHTLTITNGRVTSQGEIKKSLLENNPVTRQINNTHSQTYATDQRLIELKNINVYLANKQILKNINWTINCKDRWLLQGENGAGKTTLLKILMAEIRPSIGGEVWRNGFSARSSVWQIRRLIGYVSPELQQNYRYNIPVFDAVASGLFSSIGLYDAIDNRQQNIVMCVLSRCDLRELALKKIHQISSGQMRRVLIARAMVLDPDIFLFDEITANLDRSSRLKIFKFIEKLIMDGKTMVFVGHHPEELSGLYNRVLKLNSGRIVK